MIAKFTENGVRGKNVSTYKILLVSGLHHFKMKIIYIKKKENENSHHANVILGKSEK